MQSQRFFIGNLPAGTTEKDIGKAFQDYGQVTSIDLKEKENLVDPGSIKVLAFVTLNLFDGDVDFCIKKLNAKQINGQYLRVSVAKESFLERLKREREENAKVSKTVGSGYAASESHPEPSSNSKKFFNTNEDESYCTLSSKSKKFPDVEVDAPEETTGNAYDDEETVLITKKRAANSMRNGRIVIEGTNSAPVHIIGKQKDVKQLSDKSFDSDKKRKESVKKKKNQYQLQKSLIQKSLSSVDTSKTKKIVFDDDDEDNEDKPSNTRPLFQDDSDQDEDDSLANAFAVKSKYEGSQGAELMKLQSKMSLDPRFKIDHKFVDAIEEEPVKNENSERDWQYGILEQVVGSKVSNVSHPKGPEKKKLKMLRYDPSKGNQDEFLINHREIQPMDEEDENIAPAMAEQKEVSKEVFYMVSDNLSNSLKTRGDGFSLLSMFGKAPNEDDTGTEMQKDEKILIKKNDKNATLNPFTYDSSESENEQDDHLAKKSRTNVEASKGDSKSQAKLFVESFFIPRNDIRLKEGKAFFRSNAQSEGIESYDTIKEKLKTIINTKIKKSKRQLKGTIRKRSFRSK